MIWVIFVIIGYIAFRFLIDLNKDKYELESEPLSNKFDVIVNSINQVAFKGSGKVTFLNKRSFNLYKEGQNQIINFHYSTGSLTITWRYKYFRKEIVHEKHFYEVRNISIFEQQKIANQMISEMNIVVLNHQNDVLKG